MLISRKERNAQVVVFGESSVGKTYFTDMFIEGKPYICYSAVAPDLRRRTITVSKEAWALDFMDLNLTTLRDTDPNFYVRFFKVALANTDGLVLLYDVTSRESFDKVTNEAYTYVWMCRKSVLHTDVPCHTGRQRFGCILVGNKADLVRLDPSKREVSKEMAAQWAQSQGFKHYEVTSNDRGEVEDAVEGLVKSIRSMQRRDKHDSEENRKSGIGEQISSVKGLKNMSLTNNLKETFRKSKS